MEHYKKRLIRCQSGDQQGQKSPGQHSQKDDEENENKTGDVPEKISPSGVERKAMKQKKIARKRAVCRTKFRHTNMELFKLGTSIPTSLCKTKQPYNVCTEKTLQLSCAKQNRDKKKSEKPLPKEAITELIISSIEGKDLDHCKKTTGRHSLPQLVPDMPLPKKVRFTFEASKGDENSRSTRQAVTKRRKTVIGTETYDTNGNCESKANSNVDKARSSHSDDSLLDTCPLQDVTELIQAQPHAGSQQTTTSSQLLYNLIASRSSTLLKQNKEDSEIEPIEHLLRNGQTTAPKENETHKDRSRLGDPQNRRNSKTNAHKDPLVDLGSRTNKTCVKVSRSSKNGMLYADPAVNLESPTTKEAKRFYQPHRYSHKTMVPVKDLPVDLGCRVNGTHEEEINMSHQKNAPEDPPTDKGLHTHHKERPRLYFSRIGSPHHDPNVDQQRSEGTNDVRVLENQPINLSVKQTPVYPAYSEIDNVQSHPRMAHTMFPEIEEQLTRLGNTAATHPVKARSQEKKYDALIKDIIDISKTAMMLPFSVPNLLIMNKNYRELQMYLGKTSVSKKSKFTVTATMNELISYVCYKIFGDPNKTRLRLYTEKLLDANLKRHRAELEGFMHLLVNVGTTDERCFRDFFSWIKFISGTKEIMLKNLRERALYNATNPNSMQEYQDGNKNFRPVLMENQLPNPMPMQTSMPPLSRFCNTMALPNPHNIMHPMSPDHPYPNPQHLTSSPSHTISFPNPKFPESATVPNVQPPKSTGVITSSDSEYLMVNANTLPYINPQFQAPKVSNPHCLLSLTFRIPSSTTPLNLHFPTSPPNAIPLANSHYSTATGNDQASGSNATFTSNPRKEPCVHRKSYDSSTKDANLTSIEVKLSEREDTEKNSEARITNAKEPVENRITKSVIVKDKSMEITKGDRISKGKPADDDENEVILEKIEYSKDERSKIEQSIGIKKVRVDLEDLDTSPDFQLFKDILIEEDKSVYKKVLKKLARVKEDTARHAVIMIDDDEDMSIRKVGVGPSSIDLTHEKMQPLLIDLTNTSSNTVSNKNSNEPPRKKIKKKAPLKIFDEILVIDDDESSKTKNKDENQNFIEETDVSSDDKSQSGPTHINNKHKCTTEINDPELEKRCQKNIMSRKEPENIKSPEKIIEIKNAMKPEAALIDTPSMNGNVTIIRKYTPVDNCSVGQFDREIESNTVNPTNKNDIHCNKEFRTRTDMNDSIEVEVESNSIIVIRRKAEINTSTNKETGIQLATLVQPDITIHGETETRQQKNDTSTRQLQVEPRRINALPTSKIEIHPTKSNETNYLPAFIEEPDRVSTRSPSNTKGTISTTNKTEKDLACTKLKKTDYIPIHDAKINVQATEAKKSTAEIVYSRPEGIPPVGKIQHQNIESRRHSIISFPITDTNTRTSEHEGELNVVPRPIQPNSDIANQKNASDVGEVPEATSQPLSGPLNGVKRRYSLVSPPLNKKVCASLRDINLASTSHQDSGTEETEMVIVPSRPEGLRWNQEADSAAPRDVELGRVARRDSLRRYRQQAPYDGYPLHPPVPVAWHPWLNKEQNAGFPAGRRPSVETISNAGSDYSPEATAFEIRLDSKWYRISRTLYDKIPKGKLRYVKENNAFLRYSDDNQMEQFVENTDQNASEDLRERAENLGRHGMYLGPVNSGEVIDLADDVQFSSDAFVSEPETYSEEVSKVERFIPLDFFGFYVYVTGFQIVHGNPPISFHTFLMMHNTNRTTMLLKKYIYNLLRTGIVNFSLANQEP